MAAFAAGLMFSLVYEALRIVRVIFPFRIVVFVCDVVFFLLAALVFIVDGSLGILKISFKRFLHISILKNTLTPLHDHVRKRKGWSDEQVVARWLILQAVASALLLLMTR